MDQKPMVSVVMNTYNHENYIAEAMNGVFMQKCDFDIEFIIANDNSTDHTNQVINEIIDQTTIADHIKPRYYNHPNNKGMTKNFIWSMQQAKGKYIAMCEGDDYWIDPYKLQKQVDFLEMNKNFGLIHTNSSNFNQRTKKFTDKVNNFENQDDLIKTELFYAIIDGKYRITTASVLFKNVLLKSVDSNRNFLMGDTPLWLQFSQLTKFKFLNDTTTVYRMTLGSATRKPSFTKKMLFNHSGIEMRIYYSKELSFKVKSDLVEKYNASLVKLKYFGINQIKPMFQELLYNKTKLILNTKIGVIKIFKIKSLYVIKNHKIYILWMLSKL
jgi:glycosyltransferase involved in cell wall biosynthesis